MSLLELMTSDSDFDSRTTEELLVVAIAEPASERARALFALSRRVTESTVTKFIELVELERNQEPLMFGSMPVGVAGTIALLLNSSGVVHDAAVEQWFKIPFVERHDLISALEGDDLELPRRVVEQEALDNAIVVANSWFGEGDWQPRPSAQDGLIIVSETYPGERVLLVGSDGSALVSSQTTSWDDQQAFAEGQRSTPNN